MIQFVVFVLLFLLFYMLYNDKYNTYLKIAMIKYANNNANLCQIHRQRINDLLSMIEMKIKHLSEMRNNEYTVEFRKTLNDYMIKLHGYNEELFMYMVTSKGQIECLKNYMELGTLDQKQIINNLRNINKNINNIYNDLNNIEKSLINLIHSYTELNINKKMLTNTHKNIIKFQNVIGG